MMLFTFVFRGFAGLLLALVVLPALAETLTDK
jgi:hypothetical protein